MKWVYIWAPIHRLKPRGIDDCLVKKNKLGLWLNTLIISLLVVQCRMVNAQMIYTHKNIHKKNLTNPESSLGDPPSGGPSGVLLLDGCVTCDTENTWVWNKPFLLSFLCVLHAGGWLGGNFPSPLRFSLLSKSKHVPALPTWLTPQQPAPQAPPRGPGSTLQGVDSEARYWGIFL